MILNNYRSIITNVHENTKVTDSTGTIQQSRGYQWIDNMASWYVGIGIGTTTVNADDYKLSNMLNLDITANVWSAGGNVNNYTRCVTVATTYTNNTEESVTVTEVGMYIKRSNTSQIYYLMAHELMDEPVTLAPGESYTFTGVIDIK